MSFVFSIGTTSAVVPDPRDWDISRNRQMQVNNTLTGAVVSAWPKVYVGRTLRYSQRMTETEYLSLAALDAHSTTSMTLAAKGIMYTVVLDIVRATRRVASGQEYREVEADITIVAVVSGTPV